jgi:hypothetical protein
LVPANKAVNNDRSNQYFDYSDPSDSRYQNPGNPFLDNCSEDSDSWEPADVQKGWVARAMFYMDTRYIELELVDTPPENEPVANGFRMAQLHVLLDWNRENLPMPTEETFNQRVFDNYQHNRNPFIDFPEFADAIWVGHPSWGSWRLEHFSLAELENLSLSDDAADPDNDGLSNLMEMAIYSDPMVPNFLQPLSLSYSDDSVFVVFTRVSSTDELNLTLTLQSTSDFIDWAPVSLTGATIQSSGDFTETVSLEVPEPTPSAPIYFRVVAERP